MYVSKKMKTEHQENNETQHSSNTEKIKKFNNKCTQLVEITNTELLKLFKDKERSL